MEKKNTKCVNCDLQIRNECVANFLCKKCDYEMGRPLKSWMKYLMIVAITIYILMVKEEMLLNIMIAIAAFLVGLDTEVEDEKRKEV